LLLAYPAFSLGVDQLWRSKGPAKVGVTVGLCAKGGPQADADSDDWMHLKNSAGPPDSRVCIPTPLLHFRRI